MIDRIFCIKAWLSFALAGCLALPASAQVTSKDVQAASQPMATPIDYEATKRLFKEVDPAKSVTVVLSDMNLDLPWEGGNLVYGCRYTTVNPEFISDLKKLLHLKVNAVVQANQYLHQRAREEIQFHMGHGKGLTFLFDPVLNSNEVQGEFSIGRYSENIPPIEVSTDPSFIRKLYEWAVKVAEREPPKDRVYAERCKFVYDYLNSYGGQDK